MRTPLRPDVRPSLVHAAYHWAAHCRACGCRFDAERKAAEALRFSLDAGARSLVIPSKLDGTRRTQYVLALIRSARERCRWQELDLVQLGADASGATGADIDDAAAGGPISALWRGRFAGFVRSKHELWLRPLIATGCVRCFALEITGGTEDRQWLGCNVVLCGIAQALDVLGAAVAAQPIPFGRATTGERLELTCDRLTVPGDGQATLPPGVAEPRLAYAA